MQETWVQSLVLEDPKCQGATKPVHNNGTHVLQLLKPSGPRALLHNKRRHCNEKTGNRAAQEFRAEVNKFRRTWGFTWDKSDRSTNQGKNSHLKRINISSVCDPNIVCQQNLIYIYINRRELVEKTCHTNDRENGILCVCFLFLREHYGLVLLSLLFPCAPQTICCEGPVSVCVTLPILLVYNTSSSISPLHVSVS